ncbi:preprotein translocase subunit SecG [Candidatus Riesia pediculicola]|uniref:preprotein translocase subunit SecG n=1 Tax=Candidatus Riesia pediculicola TaxID=401619 RepID=UPI0009C296FE|nr:preprotein translocase subunit SecG [Candidatus Riesia pediculicola]ARC54218.1 hypothetical protein AOE57_01230 [Candidatus Riesia pediculicola]
MFLLFSFFIISIVLIFLIIVQPGKGDTITNSKNYGYSSTLFGSSGSGKFLNKATFVFSLFFFLFVLIMNNKYSQFSEEENKKWEEISLSEEGLHETQEGNKYSSLKEIPGSSDFSS